jgi:hypothetical protein
MADGKLSAMRDQAKMRENMYHRGGMRFSEKEGPLEKNDIRNRRVYTFI